MNDLEYVVSQPPALGQDLVVSRPRTGAVYRVKISADGRVRCSCPGFKYRAACRHQEWAISKLPPTPPRTEWARAYALFQQLVMAIEPAIEEVSTAGSLRRRKPMVRDLDLVVQGDSTRIRAALREFRAGAQALVDGPRVVRFQFAGLVLDARICDREHWAPTLLFYTGSRDENIRMRSRAKALGLKLNEHGLWSLASGQRLDQNTEESIYDLIGLQYKSPEVR